MYTVKAAYAMRQENISGSIIEGKSADIVVLDKDPFALKPEKINSAQVMLTLVEGRQVYKHSHF